MGNQFLGNRDFYRRVMAVAIPIVIQNAITNFVSLLDNIMVGQIGTLPMSGVSIVNQLLFVFNLCIFGAVSGPGIFTAQFHGCGDHRGVRHTFRFKLIICAVLTAAGWGIFLTRGDSLIALYLTGEGDPAQVAAALKYGREYLQIILWGLVPFAITNVYSGTLRESGQTVVPMAGGIFAVFVNLLFNYILIFGKLGLEPMGVRGAAIATVISRCCEMVIVMLWTHLHGKEHPFIQGAYRSFAIPAGLLKQIALRGVPLLVNEFLWASGMAVMNQCYSTCGLDVVPAMNISSTLYNLGSVGYLAMGNAVGIIMGQMLGSGQEEAQVRSTNRKLIAISLCCGAVFGALMASASGMFPQLYNATDPVRQLATQLILISAVMMPFNAYTNAAYFTLRSGGQTLVTFLFDSCFVWVICVPVAFCLSRFTAMTIVPLFIICQTMDLLKCVIGCWMLKKGLWIRNLTQEK